MLDNLRIMRKYISCTHKQQIVFERFARHSFQLTNQKVKLSDVVLRSGVCNECARVNHGGLELLHMQRYRSAQGRNHSCRHQRPILGSRYDGEFGVAYMTRLRSLHGNAVPKNQESNGWIYFIIH